ncbi:Phosphatidate cytidylyltransferase, mitochondrial [Bonamia ostreae]|uniref:Phosphatidate cytidylyltransferase, mitochondrial n=1 Tax=Bonamia ostreae TaxID=126728 RepID=A0ABV2AGG0_9EUKA
MSTRNFLKEVLKNFPKTDFAFAYGSAIFPQRTETKKSSKMVDVIFSVDNPSQWHAENSKVNPFHYNFSRKFFLSTFESWKPGVQFFPFASLSKIDSTKYSFVTNEIKYGVIPTNLLISDLLQWDDMYISGRMQKPIVSFNKNKLVFSENCAQIDKAQKVNLENAFTLALFMLPDRFKLIDLFKEITKLSYKGYNLFSDFKNLFSD